MPASCSTRRCWNAKLTKRMYSAMTTSTGNAMSAEKGRRLINCALQRIEDQQQREHDAAVLAHKGKLGPNFAIGMASEGYIGGYRDALNDALLAMNNVLPKRRDWWDKP